MSLSLDFSDYSVIDHHCHPWNDNTKELTRESFFSCMSFGEISAEEVKDPRTALHAEFTPMGNQILRQMAKFLGCSPKINDVIEARNKRSRKDYWQYCKELFEDANIQGLMVDDGYSEVSVTRPLETKGYEDFQDKSPVWTKRVSRIEPLFQKAVDESISFDDFVDRFDRSIVDAVRKKGAVGFKSVIAYRSGLNIQKPNDDKVREDYEVSKATRSRSVKHIRDWYVHRVVNKAAELGVAFHIHVGIGDIDVVFDECNPAKLYQLLHDPETWKTNIFLIHGGYPFSQEAAFYANALKNVYVDLSEMIPFASIPGEIDKTIHILDLAPPTKVLYGSDGIAIPEIHFAGAKIAKRVLQDVLSIFVKHDVYDEDQAHKAAKLILADNVHRLYNF